MTVKQLDIRALQDKCTEMRLALLDEVEVAGSGHYGSCLSAIEIFVSLYYSLLDVRPDDASVSGAALIGVQAALLHGSLPALQLACSRALTDWRGLLRGLLHYHLGTSTLRTRQVMLDLQSLSLLPLNATPPKQQPAPVADRP